MMAARMPFSSGLSPVVGRAWPVRIRKKMAAIPARAPASMKAWRITLLLRTPISRAASKSSAAARSEMPNMVRCSR